MRFAVSPQSCIPRSQNPCQGMYRFRCLSDTQHPPKPESAPGDAHAWLSLRSTASPEARSLTEGCSCLAVSPTRDIPRSQKPCRGMHTQPKPWLLILPPPHTKRRRPAASRPHSNASHFSESSPLSPEPSRDLLSHRLRVCPPLHGAHHLTDQETDRLLFPIQIILHRLRILTNH